MMKRIFGIQINIEIFYKLILSFWVCNKACPKCLKYPKTEVCISLQYLQKNVRYKLDVLPGDKSQTFLQIDTIILDVWPGMPKLPKIKN